MLFIPTRVFGPYQYLFTSTKLPDECIIQRRHHSAVCFSLPTSQMQVLVFGGSLKDKAPLLEMKLLELEGTTCMYT